MSREFVLVPKFKYERLFEQVDKPLSSPSIQQGGLGDQTLDQTTHSNQASHFDQDAHSDQSAPSDKTLIIIIFSFLNQSIKMFKQNFHNITNAKCSLIKAKIKLTDRVYSISIL